MGADQSKEVTSITRNDVKNNLDLLTQNLTQNINKVVNETITNVSATVVNENQSKVSTSCGGTNIFNAEGDMDFGANSTFSLDQSLSADCMFAATIATLNDAQSMAKIASETSAAVLNKAKNDNDMKANLAALSNLQASQKTEQGIESMVSGIMDTIGGLATAATGGSSSSKTTTEVVNAVTNSLKQQTINQQINENDLRNIINNTVKNTIQQLNQQNCEMNATGGNTINFNNMRLRDGATVNFKQSSVIKGMTDCLINSTNQAIQRQDLSGLTRADTSSDTENVNKQTGSMDTNTESKASTETTSGLSNMFKSLVSGITTLFATQAGIMVAFIIGIVFIFIFAGPTLVKLVETGASLTPAGRATAITNAVSGNKKQDGGRQIIKIFFRDIIKN